MADARLSLIIDVVGNVGRQLDAVASDLKRVTAEAEKLSNTTQRLGNQGAQAVSRFSAALDRAEAGFKRLNTVGQQFVGTGARIAAIGAGLAVTGLFPVKAAADFERALKGVVAVTAGARENYDALAEEAKRLGRETAFTAVEAAEGFKLLGQAGLDAEQAIIALEPALNLAAAGGLSLADSADISTNVLKGFGLEAEDLTRITDVLANTATSANTNIIDLGQAMSFAAPAAKAVGISAETASAAIGVLGDAGIKATRAGTGLRGILTRLADPKIQEKLADLGVTFVETADGGIDLIETFRSINERVIEGTFGLGEATEIFGRNFGTTGLVIAENVEQLNRLSQANEKAEGTAKRTADTMLEGLAGSMVELKSAVTGLIIEIGEPLLGPMETLIDRIKDVVNTITTWVKENPRLASTIAAVVGGVGAFLAVLGTLTIALGGLLQVLAFTGAGFVKLGRALQVAVTWLKTTQIQATATTVSLRGVAAAFGFILAAVLAFQAGWQLGRIINDVKVWEDSTSTVGDVVQFTFANIDRWITNLILKYRRLQVAATEWFGGDASDYIAEVQRLENELDVIDRTINRIIEEGESRGAEVRVDVDDRDAKRKLAEIRQEAEKPPAFNYEESFKRNLAKVEAAAKESGDNIGQEFETLFVEVGGELREFTFPKQPAEEAKRAADNVREAAENAQSFAQQLRDAGIPQDVIDKIVTTSSESQKASDAASSLAQKTQEVGQTAAELGVPERFAQQFIDAASNAEKTSDAVGGLKIALDEIGNQVINLEIVLTNFNEVSAQLAELVKPETKNVTVRIREERAAQTGGMIERMMSIGGKLSGFGGGDRIRALLEAGEYVVRKEAVRKYGVGFMNMVNSMSLNLDKIPGIVAARLGGLIPTPRIAYQTGGQVSGGLNINDFGVVELQVGTQGFPVMSSRTTIDELKSALKRESLVRSN